MKTLLEEVAAAGGQTRSWSVRAPSGEVCQVKSLAHMALLLVEGKVDPRDEISAGDGHWTVLESVVDTHELAAALRALGHLGRTHLAA